MSTLRALRLLDLNSCAFAELPCCVAAMSGLEWLEVGREGGYRGGRHPS